MFVNDADSAKALVDAWVHGATPARAAEMLRAFARDQRKCAALCGDRLPISREDHLAAAKALDDAAELLERAAQDI